MRELPKKQATLRAGLFESGGGLDPRFDFSLLDLLPAEDHGPGVGGQVGAGRDHVDVHDTLSYWFFLRHRLK